MLEICANYATIENGERRIQITPMITTEPIKNASNK